MAPTSDPDGIPGLRDLSNRGRDLVAAPPTAEYIRENIARSGSLWHAEDNPDGYLPLCTAENTLVADLLLPKMATCRDVPPSVLAYGDMSGAPSFRRAIADLAARTFLGRPIDPGSVAVLAGAGSVLEVLFSVIADPGDAVLVPTPSYAAFWADLGTRDALSIIPVHCSPDGGFSLTTELLDAAVAGARSPIKALLLTSPNNPLGRVLSRTDLEGIMTWCERTGIHLVVDEIYALSVFGETPFTSAASIRPRLGPRTHIIWAFSKDFGMSGLRCGVLFTENEAVRRGVEALAYWASVSGDTQHVLECLIRDEAWVDHYLIHMRARLRYASATVAAALDRVGIPFLQGDSGFFALCDLRRFLEAPTWDAEHRLWRRLLDEVNVNLTPGASCRAVEPGFFRLCFASIPTKAVVEGIGRVAAVLGN